MAKKPNYDFERKERERLKAAKKAAKLADKAAARELGRADQDGGASEDKRDQTAGAGGA